MDINKIRNYFPQLKNVIYLNTGSSGPTPSPVMGEMKRYLDLAALEGQASPLLYGETKKLDLRNKIGRIINGDEDEICFTQSTSHGLGLVFSGIDWQKNDEIVVSYPEYISGMLDCMNVEKYYGVQLNIVGTDKTGHISEDDLIKAFTDKTRLVIISHVAYHNGQKLDVKKICRRAREKNILTLVDGAQSVGAIKVDMKDLDPDFYVFPAQKWLLGEEGMGVLYINKKSLEKIKPRHMGYNSVEKFSPSEGFVYHKGAKRFEVGTPSFSSYFAFSGAIDFYNMMGEELIFSRIEKLADYFKTKLSEMKNLTILTPSGYQAGLVSFVGENIDAKKVASKLYSEKKIITRSIPWPDCLRVSLHYFNTEEDIDAFVTNLEFYCS